MKLSGNGRVRGDCLRYMVNRSSNMWNETQSKAVFDLKINKFNSLVKWKSYGRYQCVMALFCGGIT